MAASAQHWLLRLLQLHVPLDPEEQTKVTNEVVERLQRAKAKGVALMVAQHLMSQFVTRVRRAHPWIAAVRTPLDLQVHVFTCSTVRCCAVHVVRGVVFRTVDHHKTPARCHVVCCYVDCYGCQRNVFWQQCVGRICTTGS
jgi:hypothetical protein